MFIPTDNYIPTRNVIDIFYLTNAKRLLLREELKKTLPSTEYITYTKLYYKNRLLRHFYYNNTKPWFTERYYTNRVQVDVESGYEEFTSFLKENGIASLYTKRMCGKFQFILTVKLGEEDSRDEYISLTEGSKCTQWEIVQGDSSKLFSRVLAMNFTTLSEAEEFKSEIESKYNYICDIVDLHEVKTYPSLISPSSRDLHNINSCITLFNNTYGTSYSIPDNINEKVIFGIHLLRKVFKYCFTCCKKYDSDLHLLLNCGDYHLNPNTESRESREIFERNYTLILQSKNLLPSMMTYKSELTRCIENNKCLICECWFEKYDDTVAHIESVHPNNVELIRKHIEKFDLFIERVDFMTYTFIEGNNKWTPPDFINELAVEGVKYDFPRIFSGDIKL